MAPRKHWWPRGLSALTGLVMLTACGATLLTIEIARDTTTGTSLSFFVAGSSVSSGEHPGSGARFPESYSRILTAACA